ncbi:GDP-mannose 4,6-dehydratase [Candidatus Woesearchaeota archaeon]|nr:GDP-mannose 4,6-dehydratase [Candidatus Woesearchaeota archaeon]
MSLSNKSILVTGGAGFIGSHLVDALTEENPENLVLLSNFFLGKEENIKEAKEKFPKLKVCNGSAADYNVVRKILEDNKIDIVYNLAVIPLPASLKDPLWSTLENINIALNICELLRIDCFKKLIHFSSSEAYGSALKVPMNEKHELNPETPYAASKASGDLIVDSYYRTFKLDTSILRPFNNYGPRQNAGKFAAIIPLFIKKMMNKENTLTINGDGEQTRDFIYVTDTANAAVEFSKNKNVVGKTINIASGREISMNYLAELLCREMDFKGKINHGPGRPGDVRRHFADISLAKKLLNFEPKVKFEEGIKLTCDWYKKNLNKNK